MKVWWGLAASALSLVIIVLGYTAMVAGLPTTERLARNEVVVGIDVPFVGTVGDYPDPKHRHVVEIAPDGRVRVAGTIPSTYGELRDALRELGKLSDGEVIRGTTKFLSGESVVIRADAMSPWKSACNVVYACSEASIDHVFFSVRHESGGEGAIALFLPKDSCDHRDVAHRRIALVPGEGTAGPAVAYERVRKARDDAGKAVVVTIEPADELATGVVLAWSNAVIRSGAEFDGFAFGSVAKLEDPLPRPGLRSTTQALARWSEEDLGELIDRSTGTAFPGVPLTAGASAPPMPSIPRVRGAFAGQFDPDRKHRHE